MSHASACEVTRKTTTCRLTKPIKLLTPDVLNPEVLDDFLIMKKIEFYGINFSSSFNKERKWESPFFLFFWQRAFMYEHYLELSKKWFLSLSIPFFFLPLVDFFFLHVCFKLMNFYIFIFYNSTFSWYICFNDVFFNFPSLHFPS